MPWETELKGSQTVISPFDEAHQLLVHPVRLTASGGGPPDVLIIPGVNDTFFPGARNAVLQPEPSTILLWVLCIVGTAAYAFYRRRKLAAA